jgi:hypothetical protein
MDDLFYATGLKAGIEKMGGSDDIGLDEMKGVNIRIRDCNEGA